MVKEESELELLLKKTQEENKKLQEELKRLKEEAKKNAELNLTERELQTQ